MLFPTNHDNFWPRSRYYTCIYSIIKDFWEIWPLWIKQSFCVFNFNITKLLTSSHYKEKENHAWFLMVYLLACASMYALVCCTFLKASLNVKRNLLSVYIWLGFGAKNRPLTSFLFLFYNRQFIDSFLFQLICTWATRNTQEKVPSSFKDNPQFWNSAEFKDLR